MTTQPIQSTTDDLIAELEAYDAGLLNDFGGGNVGWWQDYIRAELERAHDHYADQHDALIARIRELEQAQRWISVDERLPEEDQDVIVKQVGFRRSYFAGVVCTKPGFMRVKNPVTGDWYRGFKEWKPAQ